MTMKIKIAMITWTMGMRLARINPSVKKRTGLLAICIIPILFGLLVPLYQIGYWLSLAKNLHLDELWKGLKGSLQIGISASLLVVLIAWMMAFLQRSFDGTRFNSWVSRLAILGYSMPGAVLGIGIVGLVLWINPSWLFVSVIALVFGLVTRFFAVGYNPIQSGYAKLSNSIDESSKLLGIKWYGLLGKVHAPLLRPALYAAIIMVFVDSVKELPLTLILRPFNFETVASQAFQNATDELVIASAAPSLLIILIASIPIAFLNRLLNK